VYSFSELVDTVAVDVFVEVLESVRFDAFDDDDILPGAFL
jgi:hypothetical protein